MHAFIDCGCLINLFYGTEHNVTVYCETTEQSRVGPILQDGLKIVGIKG